jgi:hypothetical protein
LTSPPSAILLAKQLINTSVIGTNQTNHGQPLHDTGTSQLSARSILEEILYFLKGFFLNLLLLSSEH